MKDEILIELAKKWKLESKEPECLDAEAKIYNAERKGYRECKRECSEAILMLVGVLGSSAVDGWKDSKR